LAPPAGRKQREHDLRGEKNTSADAGATVCNGRFEPHTTGLNRAFCNPDPFSARKLQCQCSTLSPARNAALALRLAARRGSATGRSNTGNARLGRSARSPPTLFACPRRARPMSQDAENLRPSISDGRSCGGELELELTV
jgi:hypothetical protein